MNLDLNHPFTSLIANCSACRPSGHACLSHTCPDCGCATDALYNSAGELLHTCCDDCQPID